MLLPLKLRVATGKSFGSINSVFHKEESPVTIPFDDESLDGDDESEDEVHDVDPNDGNDTSHQPRSGRDVPLSIHLPGMDAYLRSAVDPIIRQLGGLNHITDIAASARLKLDLASLKFPEMRLPPELAQSIFDIGSASEPLQAALASMVDWSKLARSFIDPGLA